MALLGLEGALKHYYFIIYVCGATSFPDAGATSFLGPAVASFMERLLPHLPMCSVLTLNWTCTSQANSAAATRC